MNWLAWVIAFICLFGSVVAVLVSLEGYRFRLVHVVGFVVVGLILGVRLLGAPIWNGAPFLARLIAYTSLFLYSLGWTLRLVKRRSNVP